jgi:hypothetical protein
VRVKVVPAVPLRPAAYAEAFMRTAPIVRFSPGNGPLGATAISTLRATASARATTPPRGSRSRVRSECEYPTLTWGAFAVVSCSRPGAEDVPATNSGDTREPVASAVTFVLPLSQDTSAL